MPLIVLVGLHCGQNNRPQPAGAGLEKKTPDPCESGDSYFDI